MIASYRYNTELIRKKRLFKSGKNYFRAKQVYRKAAGGDLAFRTATPQEREVIRLNIQKERRRERIAITLMSFLIFPLAIWLSIKFWPASPQAYKINQSFSVSASDYNEFNNYMAQGHAWIVKNEWYNAIFEYDMGYSMILENHSTIAQEGMRNEYLNQLESVNPLDVLSRIDLLISKYPNRIELYKFRAEYLVSTNMASLAEEDYKMVELLMK